MERRKFLEGMSLVAGGVLATGIENAAAQTQPATTYANVKQYGAVGDGVADDTAALQLAFTSCAGRVLYVPAGTYLVSGRMYLPSNTHLLGDGRGLSVFKASLSMSINDPLILNQRFSENAQPNSYVDSNIRIDGITFDGSNIQSKTTSLLYFVKVNGLQLEDCEVCNTSYQGVAIQGGAGVWFVKNYIHNCGNPVATPEGGDGLYCSTYSFDGSLCFDVICDHNRFENNRWSHCQFNVTRGSFSHNTCASGGESGLFSAGMSYVKIIGNSIDTQVRVDISASGIELDNPRHSEVIGNTVVNCGSDGISVSDGQYLVINENTCVNNGQEHAIVAAYATASGVGLTCTQAPPNGMHNIYVRNNNCADTQATPTQQYGVQAFLTGNGAAISNLVIENNDATGCAAGTIYRGLGAVGPNGYQSNNVSNLGAISSPIKTVVIQAPVATGNQSVTGVGFMPRSFEISYTVPGTGSSYRGAGIHDMVSDNCDFIYASSSGNASGPVGGYVVYATDHNNTIQCSAKTASLDPDGFTLEWFNVATRPWLIVRCYP